MKTILLTLLLVAPTGFTLTEHKHISIYSWEDLGLTPDQVWFATNF